MADKNLKIEITAIDKASKVLKKISNDTKSLGNQIKKNWSGVAVAVTAGVVAINRAFEGAKFGAKIKQQEEAFRNLTKSVGGDSRQIVRDLKEMSGGVITSLEAMETASRAITLGLQPDQLPRLMEISRASARAFGQDVGFMFDSITLGIGRQSKMILDNLGIIVSAETAYNKYAESLGLSASQLTDMQKKQAFANEVMEQGERIIKFVGVNTKSTYEQFETFETVIEEFKNSFSKGMLVVVQSLGIAFNAIGSTFLSFTSLLTKNIKDIIEGFRNVAIHANMLASIIPGIEDPFQGIIDSSSRMTESLESSRVGFQIWADEFAVNVVEIQRLMTETDEGLKLNMERVGQSLVVQQDTFEATSVSMLALFGTMSQQLEKTSQDMDVVRKRGSEAFSQMGNSISTSFSAMIVRGNSFRDAMKNAFKSMAEAFIAEVARMTAKWLAFTALRAATGGIFGGLFAQGGEVGSRGNNLPLPRAAQGAMIGNTVGRAVPVVAHEGEVIGTPQRLAEAGIGGMNMTINIVEPKMDNQADVELVAETLGFEIERNIRTAKGF